MLHFNKMAAVLVSLGALALSGCGGSSSDDVTGDTAKAAAVNALATTLNTAARAVNGATSGVDNANFKVTVGNRLMSVPVSEATKKKIVAGLDENSKSFLNSNKQAARYYKSFASKNSSMAAVATESEDVVDTTELSKILVVSSTSGDTVTYTIDAAVVCEGEIEPDLTECKTEAGKISVVQTVNGSSGTLAIKYSDATVLTIGYTSNSVYFEADLAEWKKAAVASGEMVPTNITAFEGAFRVTITVENATVSQEKISIVLGITKAINIVDTTVGDVVDIKIDAAATAVSVAADNGADTATFMVGFGMIHAQGQESDWDCSTLPCAETSYSAITHFNALTGTFVVSDNTITATNVGIGGETYWDKNADGSKDERTLLSMLDFTVVSGTQNTLTFVKALNLSVSELGPDSSEATTAPAGTVLTYYDVPVATYPYYEEVTKVTAGGPYTVTGTGASAGTLTAAMGTCFKDSGTDGFPLQATTCPE